MTLIISGTNRPNSNTYKLAKYYQKTLTDKGLATDFLSLSDLPETLITSDLYGQRSEAFQKIQDRITKAQKFLFVIPEYNGSFPGILKLLIDACKFPDSFSDKKVALVETNGASGPMWNPVPIQVFFISKIAFGMP